MNLYKIGKRGEEEAVRVLIQTGFRVVERNFRTKTGEIDIIAEDGETLVFVEVKNWSSYGPEDLENSITPKKQERIIKTAKYFLSIHRKYSDMKIRFDVIFFGTQGIKHLKSAFAE